MARLNIYYLNHAGERFILNGDGLSYLDVNDLRDYRWAYSTVDRLNGYGSRASKFGRYARTIKAEVRMRAFTRSDFLARMNRFHAVVERDTLAEEPGRLYVGDQYMTCYIVGGSISNAPWYGNFGYRQIEILAVRPYWCTDTTIIYNIKTGDQLDMTGKKFDLRYPYRYGSGYTIDTLNNTHYAACPAILTIYGPCGAPSIIINDVTYSVDVTLTSQQRLVIDQIENEIYVANESGIRTNVFDKRDKTQDIFTSVPAGESALLYDGSFKLSVTLVKQRSELEWTL